MPQQDIGNLLRREPFRLKLANGDSYDVTNPDLAVAMRTQVFLALPDDRWTLIHIRHIVAIEKMSPAT